MKFSACAESEMNQIPHAPQRISHGEAIFHTARRYFTNPEGIYFVEKSSITVRKCGKETRKGAKRCYSSITYKSISICVFVE